MNAALESRLVQQLQWEDIDPAAIGQLIGLAKAEDLDGWGLARAPTVTGDVTSAVLARGKQVACAHLVARQPMVVCGLPLVPMVLSAYGSEARFEPASEDGAEVAATTSLGSLHGPASELLPAERVILNFLQKLSGIATLTRRFADALGDSPTRLLDTRKMTPGFRVLEKYATACGGGFNHRIGLFDRVMLKDNHLAAESAPDGSALADLVQRSRQRWPDLVIELEVDRMEQIPPALDAGVDVLLLDNFTLAELTEAVRRVDGRAATEASGGVTLANLARMAKLGLDFISTGATVHQSTWMDIGLDWEEASA